MLLALDTHCLSWLAVSLGWKRTSSLESEQRAPRPALPSGSSRGVARADAEAGEAEEKPEDDVGEGDASEPVIIWQPADYSAEGAETSLPVAESDDTSKSATEAEAAVKRLETSFIGSSALEVLLGDISCIICFESLRGKTLTLAKCGHIYHKSCLDASPSDTCPQCRRPIDESSQDEEHRLQPSGSMEAVQQYFATQLRQRQTPGQSQERRFGSDAAGVGVAPPAALFSPRSQALASPELPSLGSPGVSGREPLPPWLQVPSQPQDRPSRPGRGAAFSLPTWLLGPPVISQAGLPGREPMPPWLPEAQAVGPRSTGPSSSRSASPRPIGPGLRLPGHSRSPRLSTRQLLENVSHVEMETVDGPVRLDQPFRVHRLSFSGARGAHREPDAAEVGSVRLDHSSRSPRGLAPALAPANRGFRELETMDGPARIDQQIRSPHSFRAFREIETIHGIP
eukprot:TRINITY_DN15823_c0_g2_i1.p1 TRINITY_DN15823_c0_g2~~TRINITY_DN15823_c0_g2_i1.p1  ORF type:complete len:454 (+),score=56.24 TRINITY_DN15823_c0_g2_i1:126-1487(+)